MSKFIKKPKRAILKVTLFLGAVLFSGLALAAAGATPSAVTVSTIANQVGKSVGHLAVVLTDVSLIAGIGFVMASFFKFHQHKLNPTQVPMSQGITLLMIGAALLLFPTMLPTATNAVFGSKATFGQVSGGGIRHLIGAKADSSS